MQPLSDVSVLDLTRLLPGPFCTWLLRGWGARVVKVEEPTQGDYLRETMPTWFEQLNAGAESIVLDLKTERESFLALIERFDIVVDSFRPGVLDRLGLGYEQLKAVNPRIVLVSLPGFSPDSADATRAGHDLTYLARSGLLSLMSEVPPIQIADLGAGLTAAAGALAALHQARATGQGLHVQAPLLDALFALGSLLGADAKAGQPPLRGAMPLGGAFPCYAIYPTADGGRVALGALEPKFWQAFCAAVGRPDWAGRPFDPTLGPQLQSLFQTYPLAHWAALAREHDFCLEPVLSMTEAVQGRDSFAPVLFNGLRPSAQGTAPIRGQHTESILTEQEERHE